MGWFRWTRTTPTPVVQQSFPMPAPEVEPEVPRTTILEKVLKWQRAFALQRAVEPTVDEVEQAREAQVRERMEAEEDTMARLIALRGSYLPGDSDQECTPDSWPGTLPGSWWTRL